MEILIKNAQIIDATNSANPKKQDIFIRKGIIEEIGKTLNYKSKKTIQSQNLCVSPGWFDLHVNFCDPGYEHKENLLTGCAAAVNGGFTGVAIETSTQPVADSKSVVNYILSKQSETNLQICPYGTVSAERNGKDISEMFDLLSAGVLGFSDDKRSIQDAGLLMRALLYSKNLNTVVMNFPNDKSISRDGLIHEGEVSTRLGLKPLPSLAEEIMILRDLEIGDYTDARLHFSRISSEKSVKLIKAAKEKKKQVTCDVSIYNLIFEDTKLQNFDTNFKLNPPLRTKLHRAGLVRGIKDGWIDAITSDHTPQDIEVKNTEFEHANHGIGAIECFYGLYQTYLTGEIGIEKFIECVAINPRKLLNIPVPEIKEGEKANLTLFDSQIEWLVTRKNLKSLSFNNPFIGEKLKGKPLATVYNGMLTNSIL